MRRHKLSYCRKCSMIILLATLYCNFHSQEIGEDSYKITLRAELKNIEAKLKMYPNSSKLNYQSGNLCRKLCRYREAENRFIHAYDSLQHNSLFLLDYFHVLIALKKTKDAKEIYYRYVSSQTKKQPKEIEYKEINIEHSPRLLSKEIASLDYYPYLLSKDKIKFLSQRTTNYSEPTNGLNFKSYLTNEIVFSDPLLNKETLIIQPDKAEGFQYGAFCLDKSHKKIFITRYDGANKRLIICVSEKINELWKPFKTLNITVEYPKFNFVHPMLSQDETKLIFASDMTGSIGGYDLWIGDLSVDNNLTNIQNLGKNINTIGDECYPTLFDKSQFMFSSNGHFGYGGLDIYLSSFDNQQRNTTPINLGKSINSERDEYGCFIYEHINYFTSNRTNKNTQLSLDKIYSVHFNLIESEVITNQIFAPYTPSTEIVAENSVSLTDIDSSISQELIPSSEKEKIEANTTENIRAQNVDVLKEKRWTTIQLLFKDNKFPISFTYCKILDKNQQIIFNNYTSESGIVYLPIETNEHYTIEIPRYKVANVYPIKEDENSILVDVPHFIEPTPIPTITNNKITKKNKLNSKTPIHSLAITTKSVPNITSKRPNSRANLPSTKMKTKYTVKKESNSPRNILENFN